MTVKSIRDIDITGKRVFFRFDFNVPLDDAAVIKDDTRIRRALPTLRYALDQGARAILSSHLGRPKGERKPELSLKPVAERLSELLGVTVEFVGDCIGPAVKQAVDALPNGRALLLENLRFHAEETKNDPKFSAELAALADVYVNDAFGTAHRAHASTVGIAELVKVKAAGLLLKEELENLEKAFSNPRRPVLAIFGGAKVSDKLGVLENIIGRMDAVLIGGGMANTFLKAQGRGVGISRTEDDLLGNASHMLTDAAAKSCALLLPEDVVVAERIEPDAPTSIVEASAIPAGLMALDIGPKAIARFCQEIAKAGTIVWNGPMGVFEIPAFSRGTLEVGQCVAQSSGFSVVGGGDTIRAVHQAGIEDKISYISTGGGAFMEFMEGKTLPGVAALES